MNLVSKTFPFEMNVLNLAIEVVIYIAGRAVDSLMFKLQYKDMQSVHRVLRFHTNVRSFSKGNLLKQLYEV